MDCSTHNSETAGPSLLALIDAQGGDIGATLLRLAHRAAAAHRFEKAAGAMQDNAADHHAATPTDTVNAVSKTSAGGPR